MGDGAMGRRLRWEDGFVGQEWRGQGTGARAMEGVGGGVAGGHPMGELGLAAPHIPRSTPFCPSRSHGCLAVPCPKCIVIMYLIVD